jgi:ribosome-associated toxin RatA of RatAB toxin-antitoxin module
MTRIPRGMSTLLALTALAAGCGERGVDWSSQENFVLREESAKKDNGVELRYWSLVDVPCQAVYDALSDVEHYADFVPGVDRTQILTTGPDSKTIQIAQHVVGRQSNAKVEWRFKPKERQIDFTTINSDLSYNDGHYEMEDSPDKKRCLVRSTFLVKEGQGQTQQVPIGVLASGTREAFLAAAQGVKKRAAAAPKS